MRSQTKLRAVALISAFNTVDAMQKVAQAQRPGFWGGLGQWAGGVADSAGGLWGQAGAAVRRPFEQAGAAWDGAMGNNHGGIHEGTRINNENFDAMGEMRQTGLANQQSGMANMGNAIGNAFGGIGNEMAQGYSGQAPAQAAHPAAAQHAPAAAPAPTPAPAAAPTGGSAIALQGFGGQGANWNAQPSFGGAPTPSSMAPFSGGGMSFPPSGGIAFGGGAPAAAPAPVAAAAPPAAHAADPNAIFRQQHGSAFDPNSQMDRRKMQEVNQYIAGNPQGGGMIAKSGSAKSPAWLTAALNA